MSARIRAKSFLLAVCGAAWSCGWAHAGSFQMYGGRVGARLDMDAAVHYTSLARPLSSRSRLDLLTLSPEPTAFERSFVCRIAKVFIDRVQVAQVAGLRIKFKIILE